MEENIKLPFVAKTYWFLRWSIFLTYLAIMGGLIIYYPDTIKSLNESNWLTIIVFVLFFIIWAPWVLLEMFTSKTIFTDSTIENTSKIIITKKWSYEDISKVETSTNGHIRINFVDRSLIKVWSGEANLNYILSILKSKNAKSRLSELSIK